MRLLIVQPLQLPLQLRIGGMFHLHLPLEIHQLASQFYILVLQSAELLVEAGKLIFRLFAVESCQLQPVVVSPPHQPASHQRSKHGQRPAQIPRQVRPHGQPRRGNAESPCYLPQFIHGNSGTISSAVLSGRPNMIFMFCTAWPAAPLTRLSITDNTTTVSPCCGLCRAMRQLFEPRTERVSGWLPAGSTSTKISPE